MPGLAPGLRRDDIEAMLRFAGFYGPDAFHVHDLARAASASARAGSWSETSG
jgi:hypothetical protein